MAQLWENEFCFCHRGFFVDQSLIFCPHFCQFVGVSAAWISRIVGNKWRLSLLEGSVIVKMSSNVPVNAETTLQNH